MGKLIHVDVELIASIIGLLFAAMDPTPLLKKDKKVGIAMGMKEKYDVVRNKRGFLIESINDYTIQFGAKVLESMLLHKMHQDQCTVGAIT